MLHILQTFYINLLTLVEIFCEKIFLLFKSQVQSREHDIKLISKARIKIQTRLFKRYWIIKALICLLKVTNAFINGFYCNSIYKGPNCSEY